MIESPERKIVDLEKKFTEQLVSHIEKVLRPGPLTYGFEYEFMPDLPMTPGRVAEIKDVLPELGFQLQEDGCFRAANGLDISFEPGGQLEYGSPPLLAAESERFSNLLDDIEKTNLIIAERFGVHYTARDYVPERESAPLCISGQRYLDMHSFFCENGGRGREMMKGTASIQLHVRIREFAELVPLFNCLLTLSQDSDFAMSQARRAIWDATDISRCQLPEFGVIDNHIELLSRIVRHALSAVDFSCQIPFFELKEPTFAQFLVHLTTMFTDVRLNLKGPTFELRTMDSIPMADFKTRWNRFIVEVERAL